MLLAAAWLHEGLLTVLRAASKPASRPAATDFGTREYFDLNWHSLKLARVLLSEARCHSSGTCLRPCALLRVLHQLYPVLLQGYTVLNVGAQPASHLVGFTEPEHMQILVIAAGARSTLPTVLHADVDVGLMQDPFAMPDMRHDGLADFVAARDPTGE